MKLRKGQHIKKGIPRFEIDVDWSRNLEINESPEGEWVQYDDIAPYINEEEFKDHIMNKCGTGNYNESLGSIRSKCDYSGDGGDCIYCGIGVPF